MRKMPHSLVQGKGTTSPAAALAELPTSSNPAHRPAAHPRAGLAGLLLGMSCSVLMQTLLATAMPRISQQLGDWSGYSWVFSVYLLVSTISLPMFGQLADHHGRRTLYIGGLAGYAVGTLLCAVAPSLPMLIAARGVQGLGAGALVPAALASVVDLVAEPSRGRVFGILGAVQVLANAVGPALGALFTQTIGWRAGFVFVAALTAPAGVLAWLGLDDSQHRRWSDWRRSVDLRAFVCVLRLPGVGRVIGLSMLFGALLISATAYLPVLVQRGMGMTPAATGQVLAPMLMAAGLGSWLGGRVGAHRPGTAYVVAAGGACLGFLPLALVAAGALPQALPVIGAAAVLIGAGVGISGPVLLVDIHGGARADIRATASGMVQFGRNAGAAAGTTVCGLVLALTSSVDTGLRDVFLTSAFLAGSVLVTVVVTAKGTHRD